MDKGKELGNLLDKFLEEFSQKKEEIDEKRARFTAGVALMLSSLRYLAGNKDINLFITTLLLGKEAETKYMGISIYKKEEVKKIDSVIEQFKKIVKDNLEEVEFDYEDN